MTSPPTRTTLPRRRLGKSDVEVSAIGLGCMGMSFAYGPADEAESLRVLHRYVELGGNFLDTAEVYGPYKNAQLLGRFLPETDRAKLLIATKFAFRILPHSPTATTSSPPHP